MSQPILQRYKSNVSNANKNFYNQDSSKVSIMQQTLSPIFNSSDLHRVQQQSAYPNQTSATRKKKNNQDLQTIQQSIQDENEKGQSQSITKKESINIIKQPTSLNDRLKDIVKKMVKYTPSRMYKNLTYFQLKIIGDKAYDHEYLQQQTNSIRKTTHKNQRIFEKKGFISSLIQKMDSIIPVMHPKHKLKTISDAVSLFAVVYIFYILSITISFHLVIDDVVSSVSIYISLAILIFNALITLNTGYQKLGNTFYDRTHIFSIYFNNNFQTDFYGLISIIVLLILDKDGFDMATNYPDLLAFLKVIFFGPFLLKFKDFSQLIMQFEEKILFKQKMQHIIQLVRLFSIIILINHIMACIWIFNANLEGNLNVNWINAKNVGDESWFYQYIMAFYFCTVTMTSVGYGDITAKNLSEYIIAILIMLTSSGVFGFSLNQIGTIFTDFYSEDKEKKKKLNIINLHMEKKNVSHSLRTQIREYLEYVWQENNEKFTNDSAAIVAQLNEDLKKELYLHQNKRIIDYLKQHGYSDEFVQKAILLIKEKQIKPHQNVQLEGTNDDLCLYLIEKGRVELFFYTIHPITNQYSTKTIQVLEEGSMFGVSEFYSGECRQLSGKALGFVNLLKITRNDFIQALQDLPEDLERFNYLKDRRILNKDYQKVGESCSSCESQDHIITECNFIHYTPDRQKVISRHNYIPSIHHINNNIINNNINTNNYNVVNMTKQKSFGNGETKYWYNDQNQEQSRELHRSNVIIIRQDDSRFEQFLYEYYVQLEEYQIQYLSYNFNYNYINPIKMWSENDDDDDDDNENHDHTTINNNNNQGDFNLDNNSVSIIVQSKLPNTIQTSNFHAGNLSTSYQNILNTNNNNSNTPLSNNQFEQYLNNEQQRHSFFDKIPSINGETVVNTPPIFTTNMNTNNLHNNQTLTPIIECSPTALEKRRKSLMQQLTPLIITSSTQGIIDRSNNNVGGGNNSNANNTDQYIQDQKPNRHLYTRNSKKIYQQSPLPQTQNSTNTSNLTKEINFNNLQQIQQMHQSRLNQKYSNDHYTNNNLNNNNNNTNDSIEKQKSISELQKQRSQNEYLTSQNSLKRTSSNQNQWQVQMKQFQKSIMQNIKTIMRTSNAKSTFASTNFTEEQSEKLGMQQIFQSFDKIKNFTIYFPLNNFSFIIYNLQSKHQITQNRYLQLLQNTVKSKNIINSYTSLLKQKLDFNKKDQIVKKAFTLKHISFNSALHNAQSFDNQSQLKDLPASFHKNPANNNNNNNLSNSNNTFHNNNGNNISSNNHLVSNNNTNNNINNNINHKSTFSSRQIQLPEINLPQLMSEKVAQTCRSPSSLRQTQNDLNPNKTEVSFDSEYQKQLSLQSPNVREEVSENNFSHYKDVTTFLQSGRNKFYFVKD